LIMHMVVYPCLFVIFTPVALVLIVRLMGAMLRLVTGAGRDGEQLPPPFDPGAVGSRRYWRRSRHMRRAGPPVEPVASPRVGCPNRLCRNVNRPGARYCSRCGTSLA
jgi:hypothetical protein